MTDKTTGVILGKGSSLNLEVFNQQGVFIGSVRLYQNAIRTGLYVCSEPSEATENSHYEGKSISHNGAIVMEFTEAKEREVMEKAKAIGERW